MTTPRYSIGWFLLVPYFAVASLNVPAGVGGDRNATNRTNAQAILSLILISVLLFSLAGAGALNEGPIRRHPYLFGLALVVPTWLLVRQWLNPQREADYRRTYETMTLRSRAGFGLITATAIVVGWAIFMSPL
jgi:hypothetical protein